MNSRFYWIYGNEQGDILTVTAREWNRIVEDSRMDQQQASVPTMWADGRGFWPRYDTARVTIYDRQNMEPDEESNMDNQHQKITGYRDLTQDEINAMNGVKALEAQFNGLIDHLKALPDADQRQVALAATHGEEAFMHAVRAIAKPERKVSQYVPVTP